MVTCVGSFAVSLTGLQSLAGAMANSFNGKELMLGSLQGPANCMDEEDDPRTDSEDDFAFERQRFKTDEELEEYLQLV